MVPWGRDRSPAPAKGQDGASTSCLLGSRLCAHQPASAHRGQRERGAGFRAGGASQALPITSPPGGPVPPVPPSLGATGSLRPPPLPVTGCVLPGTSSARLQRTPHPPPRPRRQHAGLNTQGRMSRPGAPTDVLSPWAGGAGPAGGPPNEAEGPQARVVAAAV